MDTTFKREESIFYEVVEMTDVVQRRRFLDEACAGKPAMRANLDALLAAHERATQFFEESNVSLKSSLASAGVEPAAGKNSALKLPSDEQPGTRIGHYRLLQKIGEGGGGAVYLAEQFEPVRRQVAFKIIKLGMDTKNVIARFELERQALAMMDHPNIAQVFDAGATETGRPYFVMELVRGVKITEYCDRNQLNVRQRLELFAQVCHAIQHAHQKGVIHRDIKPSNILVTLLDGAPVPKVIDFGVAKATAVDLTEKTFSTAHGHLIGTPAYMSPEQAQMSGLDIDTRSDIYSLGVLLYELLTSQTPFDANELVQSGLDEMRRTLRDEEPYRPSAKLNTLHGTELTQTAACRHIEPPRLKSLLKGDLDWVVMKCLEKDRRRRYETANGLAMDIRRFLDNEPVMARPPSRVYRLQKLVLRNKVVFASGVAVTAALIFGLGAATWAFLREKDARQRAEIREKITQAAFAVSRDRPEDADRIIVGISNVPPSLESAVAYRSLGEWHALNNRWRQAADKYTELLLVNRYDGWNTRTLDALRCGTVLAELNDPEQYDTFREQAVARFADAAYSVAAERILKATLLRSATPEFCRKLEPFAETAMLKTPLPSVPVTAPEQAVFPHRASFALISACSFDGHSVGVCFSQPLDLTSATNPASYQISGTIVTNVVLAADKKSVVLQLASVIAGNFVVAVNNVQDTAQNEIAAGGTASGTVLNLDFLALGDAAGASNAVSFSGNVAKINAGGSDLWYEGDHFVFQYLLVTNDFDFCLRVQSVTDTDGTGFARAGLMARDSLTDITGHTVTVERNADRPAVRT